MTTIHTEALCPSCFQHAMLDGICTRCGYARPEQPQAGAALPPFTTLHQRYLLGRKLGAGGFGITYIAQNLETKKRCCIKEYFPSELLREHGPDGLVRIQDEAAREDFDLGMQRFMEEAGTLQELRGNISVVDIEDYFEENGTAYFVMELLDGCNLRAFQKEHTAAQTLSMALQMLFLIGSALAEVHRFGLIHGDISPENIIITRNGDIKLIDFGAARSFTRRSTGRAGKIYLKPNYAPYEQYSLKPCQGPWTDIYALAATFYILISGQHMLDAPSRAKGAQYAPLCQLSPLVSRELSGVIDHALAFDYHDRYRTTTDFLSDLEQVVRPGELNVDLRALMPQTPGFPLTAPKKPDAADSSADHACVVDARNLTPPRKFGFFRQKKPTRMACLELCIGGKTTRRWLLPANKVMRVGRLATSDIMMPAHNLISRTHCELMYDDKKQQLRVRDLSKYGTFLPNGERMLKSKEYALPRDASFCILSPYYTFKVVIEE